MNFDEAFDRLMGHEGGYVNDPLDPGGETNWGITKRVALEFGYSGSMRELTKDRAKEIAKKGYWDRAKCDSYDPAIAFQVMDATFHHGYGNAVRFLQRAAGVAADGAVGPITVAAVKSQSVTDILMRFLSYRLNFMTDLSGWSHDGRGWAKRVAKNLLYGAQDA
jgi:lysozyme family protein